MTPLAVGQERIVAADQRRARPATACSRWSPAASRSSTTPGPRTSTTSASRRSSRGCSRSRTARCAILVQGGAAGRGSRAGSRESPYLFAEVEELPDVVEETPELVALMRNVQATFTQHRRGGPLPARGAADRGREHRRPQRALAPDRGRAADQDRGEAGAARGGRRRARLRPLSEVLARELELISIGSRIQSQVQSELDKSQREYFLRQQLKAIQEELGEQRRVGRRGERAARAARRDRASRGGPQAGRPRARRGSSSSRRRRPSTA